MTGRRRRGAASPAQAGSNAAGKCAGSISVSPAIFQYLGAITRSLAAQQPKLQIPGYTPPGAERLLFPLTRDRRDCFVRPVYDGRGYCLPETAFEAKQVVSILSLLLQTNTNRSDLPTTAVSVQF